MLRVAFPIVQAKQETLKEQRTKSAIDGPGGLSIRFHGGLRQDK